MSGKPMFREGRQAERHLLRSGEVTRIDALAFSEVTATRTRVFPCSDPAGSRAGVCHGKLCKDYGGNDPRISFVIETEDVENTRKYEFKLRTALPGNKAKLLYTLDKKNWQEFALHATFSPEEITEYFFYTRNGSRYDRSGQPWIHGPYHGPRQLRDLHQPSEVHAPELCSVLITEQRLLNSLCAVIVFQLFTWAS